MFDIFDMLKKDKDEKKAAVKQVTRETIIGDILDMDQTTAPTSWRSGCTAWAARLPAARPLRRPVRCTAWTAMSSSGS